jgi:hypothetical protein
MRVTSGRDTPFDFAARVASWIEGVIATMFFTTPGVALGLVLNVGLFCAEVGPFAPSPQRAVDNQNQATEARPTPASRIAAANDPKQVVGHIADHITDNNARMRTVRVLIQTTHLDHSVTKREEVTTRSRDGGTVRFVRQPFSVRQERVLLRGNDVLREARDEEAEISAFYKGVWTQYVPRLNTAWIRLPEQMPGTAPLDPRNIASMEQRSLFVDRLRQDRVLEVGPARTSEGQPRMAALMEHSFDQGHKERYRCEFDPARNDLPTRIVIFRDDDQISIVLDITYQEVIPGAAWFVKKSTSKFFGRGLERSPDSEAWRQATIVETKGKVHVNEPIDADEFVVKLPEGTRIIDAVHIPGR